MKQENSLGPAVLSNSDFWETTERNV
jgi:hypothetical protein